MITDKTLLVLTDCLPVCDIAIFPAVFLESVLTDMACAHKLPPPEKYVNPEKSPFCRRAAVSVRSKLSH
jgi:hypothetical protein